MKRIHRKNRVSAKQLANSTLDLVSHYFHRKGLIVQVVITLILGALSPNIYGGEVVKSDTDQTAFVDVIKSVKRGVAVIAVGTEFNDVQSLGTAFMLTSGGVFATCAHTLFESIEVRPGVIAHPDTAKIWLKFAHDDSLRTAHLLCAFRKEDIAFVLPSEPQHRLGELGLESLETGSTPDIQEGTEVACTGFDLAQMTNEFGRRSFWMTTHIGIVSCTFDIGPSDSSKFLDRFQVDALVNKGASGAPVYEKQSGRVLGMFSSFRGNLIDGQPLNFGLADCVPIWKIINRFADCAESLYHPDSSGIKSLKK